MCRFIVQNENSEDVFEIFTLFQVLLQKPGASLLHLYGKSWGAYDKTRRQNRMIADTGLDKP
jgi:hypothetical protein